MFKYNNEKLENYDPRVVVTLATTPNSQTIAYLAMHQDYSAGFITGTKLSEEKCGEIVVEKLIKAKRGHYGPFEQCHINLALGYWDHNTLMQWFRHRIISIDCQSMRYTSESITKVATGENHIEESFYFRPVGWYTDRHGAKFYYSEEQREIDKETAYYCAVGYTERINGGMPEEQARGILPTCYRQHCHISLNARSLMHILDMRAKRDAQLEAQQLAIAVFEQFRLWMPQVAEWYEQHQLGKAILAP